MPSRLSLDEIKSACGTGPSRVHKLTCGHMIRTRPSEYCLSNCQPKRKTWKEDSRTFKVSKSPKRPKPASPTKRFHPEDFIEDWSMGDLVESTDDATKAFICDACLMDIWAEADMSLYVNDFGALSVDPEYMAADEEKQREMRFQLGYDLGITEAWKHALKIMQDDLQKAGCLKSEVVEVEEQVDVLGDLLASTGLKSKEKKAKVSDLSKLLGAMSLA